MTSERQESLEAKDATSVVRNRRTDAMFVCAYMAIAALVYIIVYEEKIGEFAQSTIALVLGMFLNELKNMYSYETGTTRASATKDAAITRIAEQSAPASAAAVAAATGAPAPTPVDPQPKGDSPV